MFKTGDRVIVTNPYCSEEAEKIQGMTGTVLSSKGVFDFITVAPDNVELLEQFEIPLFVFFEEELDLILS